LRAGVAQQRLQRRGHRRAREGLRIGADVRQQHAVPREEGHAAVEVGAQEIKAL
jgi:hypothetical protein